jgi:hypothetical protein
MMPNLHTHDIMQFLKCNRQFALINRHWGLVPIERSTEATTVGTLIHSVFEDFYSEVPRSGTPVKWFDDSVELISGALFPAAAGPKTYQEGYPEFLALVKLAGSMLVAYSGWCNETNDFFCDNHLDYFAEWCEYSAEVSLPSGRKVEMRFDGLVRHIPTNTYWVLEHKTTSNPKGLIGGLSHAWQPRIYTWAAEQIFGKPIDGVLYNVITRCNPYDVAIIKRPAKFAGLPSQAQTTLNGTTYAIYRQLISQWLDAWPNADPDEVWARYATALNQLQMNEWPMFIRHPHRVQLDNDKLISQLEAVYTSVEAMTSGVAPIVPTLSGGWFGGACTSCPVAAVCYMIDSGADANMWMQMLLDRETLQ